MRRHRGIAGKSSGGYGAMVTPMLRPDLFGGLVTHAGDALFEACYQPEFPQAARALRDDYGGSFEAFWADFRVTPRTFEARRTPRSSTSGRWPRATRPIPTARCACPFDPTTGRLVPEVWERWLAWDPVRMVAGHADALRGLRAIWVDAGKSDDYFLDLGAQAFVDRARSRSGSASRSCASSCSTARTAGIEWRYPEAVGWLAERLGLAALDRRTPRAACWRRQSLGGMHE